MDKPKNIDTAPPEKLDKLHLLICLTAATSVALACIITQENLFNMAMWTSMSIVVFYVLGQFTRGFLASQVFPVPVAVMSDENEVEETTATDAADEVALPTTLDDPMEHIMITDMEIEPEDEDEDSLEMADALAHDIG